MPDDQPLRTALAFATSLQQWFSGTSKRWTFAGWVGRYLPRKCSTAFPRAFGPSSVTHLLIPAPSHGPGGNAVWDRARELLALGKLQPVTLPGGGVSTPDEETVALELFDGGWQHTLIRTTRSSWGYRLTELLGPPGYFAMLKHRLELEGIFKLHRGAVCIYTAPDKLEPIDVPTEDLFFKLARTKMKQPHERFARPGGAPEWTRGMLPVFVPPGYKPLANPLVQPWLFSHSMPTRVNSAHVTVSKAHRRAASKPIRTSRAKRRSGHEVPEDPGFNSRVCL